MQDLVQSQVREEVLYREALASGLDRDDIIVRRRLAQKMEFLAHADVSTPTDAELRQYHAAHAAQYRQAAQVDFEHVYFRTDRSGTPAAQAARQAREALAQGAPVVADNFMLGNTLKAQDRDTLVRDFGSAFADAVLQAPEKAWSEPLASAQGLHLVRVLRHVPAATLPLQAIRDRVTADMVNARVAAARDGAYQRLLARYTVVLPDGRVQVSAAPTTAVQP
jgi:parvulin-like peptidyl-prolyl isomerase